LPIAGGIALLAAVKAKLFLFDLGTLDGIFRGVVFIVVGLALLGVGAGCARLLAQQDEQTPRRRPTRGPETPLTPGKSRPVVSVFSRPCGRRGRPGSAPDRRDHDEGEVHADSTVR
jgi:hypothetical protein